MDCGKNIIEDESPNLSSNPVYYQPSPENLLLDMGIQQPFPAFTSPFNPAQSTSIPHMDWNPGTMLDNLTFIEEKIRQVKDVICSMVGNGGQPGVFMQQQVNADLTCLIVQLISTAGSLLPSLKNSSFLSQPPATGQMANLAGSGSGTSSSSVPNGAVCEDHKEEMHSPDYEELFKGLTDSAVEVEGIEIDNSLLVNEHDTKVCNEAGIGIDADSLPPGSYELLQLEEDEILAPHTHFCSICGKGFKRDANLRMHMRGHGDEYKSPAALAKPPRDESLDHAATMKRYSCRSPGARGTGCTRVSCPLRRSCASRTTTNGATARRTTPAAGATPKSSPSWLTSRHTRSIAARSSGCAPAARPLRGRTSCSLMWVCSKATHRCCRQTNLRAHTRWLTQEAIKNQPRVVASCGATLVVLACL